MARGKKQSKQIEGQMTLQMCMNPSNYVVQHNSFVRGKQTLSINAAKIIRLAIMQIRKEDPEFQPYKINISELSEALGVSSSNLYRDIDGITGEIMEKPVFARTPDGRGFIKCAWVSSCAYHPDEGLYIKLNNDLRPYLLNLQEQYTQYPGEFILTMKSVYSIRIFEMMQERVKIKTIPIGGYNFEIPLKEIRECCNCEDILKNFGMFRKRVLDAACEEINSKTTYRIKYDCIKTGRSVTSILFNVDMCYHPQANIWPTEQIQKELYPDGKPKLSKIDLHPAFHTQEQIKEYKKGMEILKRENN